MKRSESGALCLVTARDYARHFEGAGAIEAAAPAWDGIERRASSERRANQHDRRWDKQRGRRFRLSDRRSRT
jgi:hypothetical protein